MASFCQCITILVSVLILGSACKTENPYYCPGAPYDNCKFEAGVPIPCMPECSGAAPACDMERGECVQCTAAMPEACTGDTPACRSNTCQGCNTQEECGLLMCLQDGSCGRCTRHADCTSSLACLPDGMCASDTNVAYVDPTGTDTTNCTKEKPCKLVSDALARNRPYVKFTGITNEAVNIDNGRQVAFLAEPGAKLTCNTPCTTMQGAIVSVRGNGTSLTVHDLSISDADLGIAGILVPDSSGDPILTFSRVKVMNNKGPGITMNGGTVTISQSEILANLGGGIQIVAGQFDLTNNFIADNGTPGTVLGGVKFQLTNTGTRRFEFNTVTGNTNYLGAMGVMCLLVQQPVTFSNNIVYGNTYDQVSGTTMDTNCSWTYSDIGPEPPTGTGNSNNLNTDPSFASASNFHLGTGSPMRDAADPSATLAVDIDGQGRPQPQGERRDIGADEVP